MKRILTSILILISLSGLLSADQLAYISREQAVKGAALIRSQQEVLLFCGCCEDDPKVYLRITYVSVQHTGYKNYFEVIIKGISRTGERMTVEADFAYVHLNKNGKAVPACVALGFACDPCVKEMSWE